MQVIITNKVKDIFMNNMVLFMDVIIIIVNNIFNYFIMVEDLYVNIYLID